MPHFGIICPPVPGHVNPLCAVARSLIARGHRVTFFQVADLAIILRRREFDVVELGADRFPPGTLPEFVTKLSSLEGLSSLKFAIECGCNLAKLVMDYGPAAIRAAGVDALLVDQNEPAGGTVAEYLQVPFISVCTSLPLNREPSIPPPFLGWSYSNSFFARSRNRLGYAIADYFVGPLHDTLNRYRKQWSLQPLGGPNDSFSQIAQIAQMPREFDFPRSELPPCFHYCGPWMEGAYRRIEFPFERLDGRPLIYGSLGTLQKKNHRYFHLIAEACTGLDVQLVLSLGEPEGTDIPELPGDPIVVHYAPQEELVTRAALVVTHSGMNTSQQALYYGVPCVAIPITHDQPAIAARLARTGAGIVVAPGKLNASSLQAAIRAVLPADSSYRMHAKRMQIAGSEAGGADHVAAIIEAALDRELIRHPAKSVA